TANDSASRSPTHHFTRGRPGIAFASSSRGMIDESEGRYQSPFDVLLDGVSLNRSQDGHRPSNHNPMSNSARVRCPWIDGNCTDRRTPLRQLYSARACLPFTFTQLMRPDGPSMMMPMLALPSPVRCRQPPRRPPALE